MFSKFHNYFSSKHFLPYKAVSPNLLKFAEHLTVRRLENTSCLKADNVEDCNFLGGTSRLLKEHLWSPEQWLGNTALKHGA